jgi:hypothetical protein
MYDKLQFVVSSCDDKLKFVALYKLVSPRKAVIVFPCNPNNLI